jgi:hypothetical protein
LLANLILASLTRLKSFYSMRYNFITFLSLRIHNSPIDLNIPIFSFCRYAHIYSQAKNFKKRNHSGFRKNSSLNHLFVSNQTNLVHWEGDLFLTIKLLANFKYFHIYCMKKFCPMQSITCKIIVIYLFLLFSE